MTYLILRNHTCICGYLWYIRVQYADTDIHVYTDTSTHVPSRTLFSVVSRLRFFIALFDSSWIKPSLILCELPRAAPIPQQPNCLHFVASFFSWSSHVQSCPVYAAWTKGGILVLEGSGAG